VNAGAAGTHAARPALPDIARALATLGDHDDADHLQHAIGRPVKITANSPLGYRLPSRSISTCARPDS